MYIPKQINFQKDKIFIRTEIEFKIRKRAFE